MINCSLLTSKLNTLSIVTDCNYYEPNLYRIGTSFTFPDGVTGIDLYIKDTQPLLGSFQLSDEGEASHYLEDLGVDFMRSSKRRLLVEECLQPLGFRLENANIVKYCNSEAELVGSIFQFVQAVQAISNMYRFHKSIARDKFQASVEDYLDQLNVPFEMNKPLLKQGKVITSSVDFVVGETKLIHLISSTPQALEKSLSATHRKQFKIFNAFGSCYSQATLCSEDQFEETKLYLSEGSGLSTCFVYPEDNDSLKDFVLPVAS